MLIETIQAAFEMDEILYELRDHCAGLNAGRWDYIFSIVKTFRSRGRRWVMPDRKSITMTVPFMRAYTELLVATCHKRGAHAIGGMSAFIPNRRDPEVTERALDAGHAPTSAARPPTASTARGSRTPTSSRRRAPNSTPCSATGRTRSTACATTSQVTAAQLLDIPSIGGEVTEAGVRDNIAIAIRYIESWLRGTGAAAIDNLMEDAATAEISRSQIWQWLHENTVTAEGTRIDQTSIVRIMAAAVAELPRFEGDRFDDAISVFRSVALEPEFPTFLTVGAYARFM